MFLESFRAKITLVLLSASIIIVLVLGGLWIYTTYQTTKNSIGMSNLQDARLFSGYFGSFIRDIANSNNVSASSPYTVQAVKNHDTGELKKIGDNLVFLPDVDLIIILDADGNVLYHSEGANTTNFVEYGWYDLALKSNGTYVTNLYYSDTLQNYGFSVSSPVVDNGSIIGMIVSTISSDTISDMISSQKIDPTRDFYILDGQGVVVATEMKTMVPTNTNLSHVLSAQRIRAGSEGIVETSNTYDKQLRIVGFSPMPVSGWGSAVSTPMGIVYSEIFYRIVDILIVLVLLLSVVFIGSFFLSVYLTRPLTELSKTMEQVSAGNYSVRGKVETNDEIGNLSKAFNSMMDRLERSTAVQKQATEELNNQKQRAELFLDLMSHDINNMLQIGIGFLDMALVSIKKDAEEREYVKKALDSLHNSTKLIDNVGKLQKVEARELRHYPIDVGQVLSEVRSDFLQVLDREVTVNLTPVCGCTVNANELLKDVFVNLVGNAIKHSTGPITIDLSVKDVYEGGQKYCKISVEDNGPGIPPEVKGRLFARFQRGATKAHGRGLGLYLVKTLVEDYRGKIWVEDRVPGNYKAGSRFVILLPSGDAGNS
ncbi:sensor histidine kinase [Methanocella arvoryzae]|uniref:histidine kinase n=1 Tax=Methanocella arvoryzae (strain DSM 22066 / NBRC 105507 / MRE50) TaxID=351160 RepID=Q0W104_METAR|nr:sensor histidine kinase [Methanocella arvoryzae]CAJ37939.1 putative signal transduction histidine kinase [Methanocella arvoryzae MRE50]